MYDRLAGNFVEPPETQKEILPVERIWGNRRRGGGAQATGMGKVTLNFNFFPMRLIIFTLLRIWAAGNADSRQRVARHSSSPRSVACFAPIRQPSDAECESIRQFLSTLRKDFAAVTGEITRMQAVLVDLANQSERLRDFIDVHQALVSMARRLPEDVVREILLHEAPLLLVHVCSGWRRIAFATPQLWSSLHVVVPNAGRLRKMSSAVDNWLTRSGTLPLSITLAVSAACEAGSDNVATMIDVLTNFSPRWKHIKITLTPSTTLTPSHESPRIGCTDARIHHVYVGWERLLAESRLTSCDSLEGISQQAHLKNASSYEMTTTVALVILRQCHNLTTCTICLTSDRNTVEDDPESPPSPLVLSRLTDLTIDNREYSQTNAVAFFGVLRVPELQRFEYRGPKGSRKNAFQHCIELLPSLTYLRLEDGTDYDPWSTAGQWGRENPPASANDILRLLTPDPSRAAAPSPTTSWFNFRAGCARRLNTPSSASGLPLCGQREFDMMPYLGELVTQGLQIELTYLSAPLPPTYSPWEGREAMAWNASVCAN
ncbi:hypothetical protein B0H14DRAFT_3146565, partial [Mycena olivaceomarginata]